MRIAFLFELHKGWNFLCNFAANRHHEAKADAIYFLFKLFAFHFSFVAGSMLDLYKDSPAIG